MNEDLLQNIRTSQDAERAGLPVFKVISDGAIKAYKDDKGVRRFSITASSDVDDLAGDFFREKALKRMASTAKGMTMFLNHSYNVPDDVFGAVEESTLAQKTVFNRALGKEVECLCLTYDGMVTEVNPQAVKTHEMMMEGIVTLGGSVSVLILEKSNTKDGRRGIDDVLNLECSIVGLPCNPTSWVQRASKALKLAELKVSESPEAKGNETVIAAESKQASTSAPHDKQLETTEVITKETAMTEPIAPVEKATGKKQIIQKGLFADVLKESESSIYHLTDLLCSALWRLYCACYYDGTDVDVDAELNTLCDEFKAVAMERLAPRFKGTDSADKSAENLLDAIKNASAFAQFLTNDRAVTKALSEIAEKAGRRNSSNDQQMIDDIHGLTVDLGAECKSISADESKDAAAPDADKTASQASSADSSTVETLQKSLTEAGELVQKANADKDEAIELAQKAYDERDEAMELAQKAFDERDEAVTIATNAVKALEDFGNKPMQK